MADNLWFVIVGIGPLLLGVAIAYALMKRRRLTGTEKMQQEQAIERLYDKPRGGREPHPRGH